MTELDVSSMLGRATRYERSGVEGFMIHAQRQRRPWVIIVEPDIDLRALVIVTADEVGQ